MYYDTRNRGDDNTTLAGAACRAFVGLSVTISVIGFWSKGVLPGVLLTVAMGAVVYLLSISLSRIVQAANAKAWRTVFQTGFMAAGFVTIEAALNHIGLEHLNVTYGLAPEGYLWPACWFISLVNVFATETYTSELDEVGRSRTAIESETEIEADMTNWNEWQAHRRQNAPFAEALAHIRSKVRTFENPQYAEPSR